MADTPTPQAPDTAPCAGPERLAAAIVGLTRYPITCRQLLRDYEAALRAAWEAEDVTGYRAWHTSGIVLGHYRTRDAAMAHAHAEHAGMTGADAAAVAAAADWRPDCDDSDTAEWECYMPDAGPGAAQPTGYVVTPLVVAAAYDSEADA